MPRRSTKGKNFRGTKHGTGRNKWRVEKRRYKKKDGTWSYYSNYRERYVSKSRVGKRKIRYRSRKKRG